MTIKCKIVLICLFMSVKFFAQKVNLNTYKYIVVPSSYGFLGEEDKYQLNSLTKFLFNKYGYTAFLENEMLPEDLKDNPCMALRVEAKEIKGSLFKTQMMIDLRDCKGTVVYSSKVGETREKDYAKAYNLALRDAFETYKNYGYKYIPNIDENLQQSQTVNVQNISKNSPVLESRTKVDSVSSKTIESKTTSKKTILYAQPIENGYQVVDTTPKVVMILLKTGKQNVFIVKNENAIVYREDGFWYYSKNDGDNFSLESIEIKF